MRVDDALTLARGESLYPSLILHGGRPEDRLEAAERLGRAMLCDAVPDSRPCGECRHCRRAGGDGEAFHPDFRVLDRDLKTATSVEATRAFLSIAHQSPFEARGQVFVIADANSLGGEAANTLLKTLEEPPTGAPRHFFLLAASREELLPTLRSRSWSVYLGPSQRLSADAVADVAGPFARALAGFRRTGSTLWLLGMAEVLEAAGGWEDPRAETPWAVAAAAVMAVAREQPPGAQRVELMELAESLLSAPRLRLRSIRPGRIIEGLVAGTLTGSGASCSSLLRRL